jgi:hypothetical protein
MSHSSASKSAILAPHLGQKKRVREFEEVYAVKAETSGRCVEGMTAHVGKM